MVRHGFSECSEGAARQINLSFERLEVPFQERFDT